MIFRIRLILADAAVAVAIVAAYAGFAAYDGADGSPAYAGPGWLGWLIAAAVGLPIGVRRLWPVAAALVVTGGCVAASVLDVSREPLLPAALALYAVGLLTQLVVLPALAVAVLGAGVFVGAYAVTPSESLAGAVVLTTAVVLLSGGGWAVGVVVRRRREAVDRAATGERARIVAEERMRIAREVHDIVSHNLSLIAVRAGVANHVALQHPDEARAALRSIEETSRSALAEMRGVLGLLRSDAERAPVPGLAGLAELAERARAAGATVDLRVETRRELPIGVQLAVYRIVQESLTNVVKHARPPSCRVRVVSEEARLTVEAVDEGAVTRGTGDPGHGLIGLRERVAMYGGEFAAGPRPSGGFRVYAVLPVGEAS